MSGAVASDARVRIGLLGAGRIAGVHAESLTRNPEVAAVVVHDPVVAAAERLARSTGVAVASSMDEVLRGADAVVIATPTATHPELVRTVAAAGLPVFCEKPLALTLDETDAVLADVAAAGVQLQVGFQRRFDPGYVAARDAVTSGRIGRLLLVSANAHDHEPPPASYLPASGGIHLDMLIHEFDVVPWVTGREVVEVYATGAALTDPVFADYGDVDTTAVILTLDDGTPAVLSASRTDPRGYDARLELLGTADSLAVGLDSRTPLRPLGPGALTTGGLPYQDFIDRFRPAYAAEMDAFVALVQGRGPNGCTGEQARKATVIALAAGRSLRERRPVSTVEVAAS
jgi:myo-inositol 2-dehydrogenase / D-chiro-inositol 1-dehydrogenase